MYSVPPGEQTLIFVASLGVGFLLGILYDFLRALRLSFTKSKIAIVIFDLLYFFLVAFFSYLFILAANKGEVRSYIIIGELIGAVFYYFALGVAVVKVVDAFVIALKRFFRFVIRIVVFPFTLIKRVFTAFFTAFASFFEKSGKKFKKICKKVLPKVRVYVYNLLGILCAGTHKSQKGGKADGKSKKENSTQTT